MNQLYCLLVSSCDAYEDCWPPFFTLFSTYWQPADQSIYLNTETQEFGFPGLEIHCPRVGLMAPGELAWSARLARCLDAIPHEIVLYVQEDYFLKDKADVATLDALAELMHEEDISHISLERLGRPGQETHHRFLNSIDQRAEYRISAQAGLWKVPALKSYLRNHETVWEFEWYGTRRARRRRDTLLYVNDEYEAVHGKKVLPYDGTGVVQGRWARPVVEKLFASHGIEVDYARRGFLEDHRDDSPHQRPRLVRAARRLRSL